MPASAPKTHI